MLGTPAVSQRVEGWPITVVLVSTGGRVESGPTGRLDRVWPDAGPPSCGHAHDAPRAQGGQQARGGVSEAGPHGIHPPEAAPRSRQDPESPPEVCGVDAGEAGTEGPGRLPAGNGSLAI
jgi:hypothetical protein